jgi:pteridine reductase
VNDAEPVVDLRGRCALVTGAAHRVGRAIALELGRAGMTVAIHYRSSAEDAERTADDLRRLGGHPVLFQADLSTRDGARALGESVLAELGRLDVLVPSAAGFERVVYDAIDDDAWDRMMVLNLAAPFALVQKLTPALRRQRGSITFITCSSTRTPLRNYLPYVVSKGAVAHLMRTLSLELAPEVRVNAVGPGTVLPPPDYDTDALDRIRSRIPLGRLGSPDDIARAVVFLAKSPFITGQELIVDGGRTVAGFERFG